MKQKTNKSRWYYFLGIGIILIGLIIFSFKIVTTVKSFTGSGNRIVVPGENQITLKEAGTYNIFYEYRSNYDGKFYDTSMVNISGLESSIYNLDTNTEIQLLEPSMNTTYTVQGREGVGIFRFKLDKPATIKIKTSYNNDEGPDVVLNISHIKFSNMFINIGGAILILFTSLVLGIGIIIVTFIRRRKYKRHSENFQSNYNIR